MQSVAVYLDGWKLPVNPAKLQFTLPTHSARYELVGAGEAEILQGAKLANIRMEGYFPGRAADGDGMSAGEACERVMNMLQEGQPIRLIYTGKHWDVNLLVSIQSPVFTEVGGSTDIEYRMDFRKWVEVGPELLVKQSARRSAATRQKQKKQPGGSSYTVKAGDTLSHIAQYALGDASRWREIYACNQDNIKNPNLIYVGQVIKMPEGAGLTIPSRATTASSQKKQGGTSSKGKTTSASAPSKQQTVKNDAEGNGKLVVGANLVPGMISAGNMMAGYGRR